MGASFIVVCIWCFNQAIRLDPFYDIGASGKSGVTPRHIQVKKRHDLLIEAKVQNVMLQNEPSDPRGSLPGKGKASRSLCALFFLVVPIAFLLIFTYFPLLCVIRDSFYSMTYTKTTGFVGLENYGLALQGGLLAEAALNSVYYIIASVVQVFFALALAVILTEHRHSTLFKACLFIPYLINGISVGYMFRIFFSRGAVLDTVLTVLGFPLEQLPFWLRDQSVNKWALAGVSVWRYTGLSMVIFMGALSSIKPNCIKAACLDGAGAFKRFCYISWPAIRPVVLLELALSVVSSLSEFEIPYAVAAGGANGTATYMVLIYRIAFVERKVGLASAMSVILLCQIILSCWALVTAGKLLIGFEGGRRRR